MVPSLPLWLWVPLMPTLLTLLFLVLVSSAESSMFSTSPRPKVGVGMRKMRLLVAAAWAKLGWVRVQLPASARPVIVNRSSTPPLGLLGLGLPLASKKNGKRASRVGPVWVINAGRVSLGAWALPATENCGLVALPVPPIAGWAWHIPQETSLNRGPRPLSSPPWTTSGALNCPSPLLKKVSWLAVRPLSAAPEPRLPPCTPGSV